MRLASFVGSKSVLLLIGAFQHADVPGCKQASKTNRKSNRRPLHAAVVAAVGVWSVSR